MDIKDFIIETISGVVDATSELQEKYEAHGVVLNPPTDHENQPFFSEDDTGFVNRRVEMVLFDVAVTATNEDTSGGRAGLKILALDAGVDGKQSASNERVSRVKFSIPIAFAPSGAEQMNIQKKVAQSEYFRRRRT